MAEVNVIISKRDLKKLLDNDRRLKAYVIKRQSTNIITCQVEHMVFETGELRNGEINSLKNDYGNQIVELF